MKLQMEDRTFVCQVTHAKRKTVQIKLLSPHEIAIIAPMRMSEADLKAALLTKSSWLLKQSSQLIKLAAETANTAVAEGEPVLYLGNRYTLRYQTAANPDVECYNETITISIPSNRTATPETILKSWYQCNASRLLKEKTAFWAPRLGVTPMRITLRDQKTRWGSCSSKGSINYNWRVVMAPPAIIDYLVVHELCHMLEPNHSHRFWQLVETALPAYKSSRKWLKDNGRLLSRIL